MPGLNFKWGINIYGKKQVKTTIYQGVVEGEPI
jgi:hypothetical protein